MSEHITAAEALERLKGGNRTYLATSQNLGDVSPARIRYLFENGQAPFACIVACADSRVVPEHIFTAGLGELFTVRVAGNVVGDMELASCLYAADHLGTKLVLVLGHTHCGAIETAIGKLEATADEGENGQSGGRTAGAAHTSGETVTASPDADGSHAHADSDAIAPLVSRVARAIGDERDPYRASVANVRAGVAALCADPALSHLMDEGLEVHGAVYHTHSGEVEFLDD